MHFFVQFSVYNLDFLQFFFSHRGYLHCSVYLTVDVSAFNIDIEPVCSETLVVILLGTFMKDKASSQPTLRQYINLYKKMDDDGFIFVAYQIKYFGIVR